MSAELTETTDEYSRYLINGYELRIADAGLTADQENLDLAELWEVFREGTASSYFSNLWDLFREYIRLLGSPYTIIFCDDCGEPWWEYDELRQVLNGSTVCQDCITDNYTFCDNCDGYYHDSNSDAHEHDRYDRCCSSPQPEFAIRNNGEKPLGNDTRVTITLPKGEISGEGMQQISDYLRQMSYPSLSPYSEAETRGKLQMLAYDMDEIGPQWQTRQGNYPKRLSSHAYKLYKLKLTPEIMSQIGVIARDHSRPVDFAIEITRNLNLPPEDFCNEDSCWWNSYAESRCAFKTNGGFGLRTFSEWGDVTGRAWVLPLKKTATGLTPTFDTRTPAAFVVFNGYGDLSSFTPARIMSHMAGWTYKRINFACDPMYVNSGGYLIAPEDITGKTESLNLSVNRHSNLYDTERTMADVA